MGQGVYRTDDLALATILAMDGHEYKLVRLNEKKAVWDFNCSEDATQSFDKLIADFWAGTCVVEPRAFTSRWARMGKELFALLPRVTVHSTSSAA